MKLCLMTCILSRGDIPDNRTAKIQAVCELGQSLQIDGVDLDRTYGLPPQEVRRILADYGLKTVIYTLMGTALNAATPAARVAGVDSLKSAIDIALALGADKVMVVTPGKSEFPRDVSRGHYIAAFQESAALARQAGVTLTIENFGGPGSPFVISSDILEAIREVPGLALTFDNGNTYLGGEDPASSFRRCAAHVVHAHFKDWVYAGPGYGLEGLDGRRHQSALIGEGLLDTKSCLTAMQEAGYAGYINIEYEGKRYMPDEATRKAAGDRKSVV